MYNTTNIIIPTFRPGMTAGHTSRLTSRISWHRSSTVSLQMQCTGKLSDCWQQITQQQHDLVIFPVDYHQVQWDWGWYCKIFNVRVPFI